MTTSQQVAYHSRRQVQVRDLRAGDVLVGSGATVVQAPSQGARTPHGKCDLIVQYPNGRQHWATWNKHTRVRVAR